MDLTRIYFVGMDICIRAEINKYCRLKHSKQIIFKRWPVQYFVNIYFKCIYQQIIIRPFDKT